MHCYRVAAVGQVLAHHLFLSTEQKSLLYQASLLHHYPLRLLSGSTFDRLLADVLPRWRKNVRGQSLRNPEIDDLLAAFHKPGSGSPIEQHIAAIIRIADWYDCEYEASTLDGRTVGDLIHEMHDAAQDGLWPKDLPVALEQIVSLKPLGDPREWILQPFAAAAARILALMRNSNITARQLEQAAGSDPTIAGNLMRLANSALFGARGPATTLSAAITRLGFQTTRKVIATALMRPMLNSERTKPLWLHSLEAADIAEQLAERSGVADPGEAFLCGLLHDAGALVLCRLPLYDSARLHGLEDGGCPTVYAEQLLFRTDHAAIGAELATHWRLPDSMVDAIRHHHRPENSTNRLAHLLYATEFLSGRDEDLPSNRRLLIALDTLRIPLDYAVALKSSQVSKWLAAA